MTAAEERWRKEFKAFARRIPKNVEVVVTYDQIAAIAIQEGRRLAEAERQAQIETQIRQAEVRRRQDSITKKRRELDGRMEEIESGISGQKREITRGTTGYMFAPDHQKPIALEIIRTASEKMATLLDQKEKLQAQIDALPLE
ncbi:MAG: hypothetical protein HQL39_04090 [Alphaproteobacteria bacterium]|nr:hypothetical protein [Alphaproteobacteria bacterium]